MTPIKIDDQRDIKRDCYLRFIERYNWKIGKDAYNKIKVSWTKSKSTSRVLYNTCISGRFKEKFYWTEVWLAISYGSVLGNKKLHENMSSIVEMRMLTCIIKKKKDKLRNKYFEELYKLLE